MKTGLPSYLFLIFLVLKLTGIITWSWWWVTAPLWGMVPLVILFSLIAWIYYTFFESDRAAAFRLLRKARARLQD